MGDVGVALRPDRVVELVQVDAVGADPGGVRNRLAVSEAGINRQSVGRGVHDDGVRFVHDGVDAGLGPEAECATADGLAAAHTHGGRHGAYQVPVVVDGDLFGGIIGDGDVGLTDAEADLDVILALEPLAERFAVQVGRSGNAGPRRVVALRAPVGRLIVDPIPRPVDGRVRADPQRPFGGGAVRDGLIEAGHHHRAHAIGALVTQWGVRRGGEPHRGLPTGHHGGKA